MKEEMLEINGVKVFSATKAKEREYLGELITDWIRNNPDKNIVEKVITQSSDSEFHCLTITFFYYQDPATIKKGVPNVIQSEQATRPNPRNVPVAGSPVRMDTTR